MIGIAAVDPPPAKSPANCIFPSEEAVASPIVALERLASTYNLFTKSVEEIGASATVILVPVGNDKLPAIVLPDNFTYRLSVDD